MDLAIAQRIANFIYEETGLYTIVCDDTARIIAAQVATRVGTAHSGAQRLLSEKLPHITISKEEEEASGGVVRMGVSLPIVHNGAWIGTFGITGNLENTVPIAKIIAGIIDMELKGAGHRGERLLEMAKQDVV